MRTTLPFLLVTLVGCGRASPAAVDEPDAPLAVPDADGGCAASHAGAPCVLAAYDAALGCDPAALATLRTELDARATLGPLWAGGRALFRSPQPIAIAGDWNGWSTTALVTTPLCGDSALVIAVGDVPIGYHTYKHALGEAWSLDATNPAFAYDDFVGNADGMNSVLNTPGSGRGHVIHMDPACSTALGNCRDVTAYLPPDYTAPATAAVRYPVVFLHDGQNVWSDHDCCFGHTGWEVDATLDAEIAAGHVAPIIAIAADHSIARNAEYGLSIDTMMTFITFQVEVLQPQALAQVRGDEHHLFVAGSSLGGLVSMELVLRYPSIYAGAGSLSGAFWPNMDVQQAVRDHVAQLGKQPVAIYLDHGGAIADNSDGAADSVEVRDLLVGLGWQRADSPSCAAPGPSALCYFSDPGATHDELAWKARVWRMLRFFAPT